jgi:rfaE bifunctional protein kinase chain/domain
MRLLHTSDWHLGQTLHDFDRSYEHRQFLDWLLGRIAAERPDALLIAGDVFDNANPSIRTTQKLRMVHRQQQLLRVDMETPPSREVLASKLSDYRKALPECDVVLLSDYGKGGLAHVATMIREGRRAGKRVLVDPKGDDYSRYRGASVVTPNLKELEDVVGRWRDERDLAARAQALRAKLRLDALLLTRGEDGMTLYRPGRAVRIKGERREVADVTGAGDTVIAVLAVMLAAGESVESAARFANRAGGVKVTKFGTAVVTREELSGSA